MAKHVSETAAAPDVMGVAAAAVAALVSSQSEGLSHLST